MVTNQPGKFFMEHIIKESPEETIKRFELGNGNIWVIKQGDRFGIGVSKKEALKLKTNYANTNTPPFLYNQGTTDLSMRQEKLWRPTGMIKFILSLLPLKLHSSFLFRTVYHENSKTSCIIVSHPYFTDTYPIYIWSNNGETVYDQVRNCVYQLYILIETQQSFVEGRNKKLLEWENNWYSKLIEKRF